MTLVAFAVGLLLGVLLTVPFWPDPYHREGKVNFWVWAYRELDELMFGEKG